MSAPESADQSTVPRLRAIGVIAMCAAVFILLFARAMNRELDPDEHQFVSPALLLNVQGLHPYIDYPLFHTPLLVYIYALLIKPFAYPMFVLRTFSALVGTATAMLLFGSAVRWARAAATKIRWCIGLSIVALFLSARVFTYTNGWTWNHDSSTLALVGAVLLQLWASERRALWAMVAVGLLMGVAASIRLTTTPAGAALVACWCFAPSALSLGKRFIGFILTGIGGLISLIPTLLLFRAAPDQFIFGNLTYPRIYKLYVLAGSTHHTTFLGKIGHFFQTWFSDPGNAAVVLLLGAAIACIISMRAWRGTHAGRIITLFVVVVALWFGITAPFQMQIQYHSALLPFFLLIIAAATAPSVELRPLSLRGWPTSLAVVSILVAAVNFPRWYWMVTKLPTPREWTPMEVHAAGEWLKANVPASSHILTVDPIIPLEVGIPVDPHYATGRLAFHVGPHMTDADRERFGILWGPQLQSRLDRDPPAAIFYGLARERLAAPFISWATEHNYRRLESPDKKWFLWVR